LHTRAADGDRKAFDMNTSLASFPIPEPACPDARL